MIRNWLFLSFVLALFLINPLINAKDLSSTRIPEGDFKYISDFIIFSQEAVFEKLDGNNLKKVKSEWKTETKSTLNKGYIDTRYWYRFEITSSNVSKNLVLDYNNPLTDRVDILVSDSQGVLKSVFSGNAVPFNQRKYKGLTHYLPFSVKPNTNYTIYIDTQTRYSHQLKIKLWQADAFEQYQSNKQILLGILFGLICAITFYNLIILTIVKEKVYAFYVSATFTTAIFWAVHFGVWQKYITPSSIGFNLHTTNYILPITVIFSVLFAVEFLNLKEKSPKILKLIYLVVALTFVELLIFMILGFNNHIRISSIFCIICCLLVFASAVSLSLRKNQSAIIFIVAWCTFIIGATALALNKLGYIQSTDFVTLLAPVGSGIEALLLSIALAVRINQLKSRQIELLKERYQVEKESEIAQAKNLAKSKFLANMSHEIRTPMTGVLGMTELLYETGLSEKQERLVQSIKVSGNNLLHIINDVLDYSKIEAGEMSLEAIDFNLEQLIAEIFLAFSYELNKKDLTLVATFDESITKQFNGDPYRLRQILVNIIGNAIKFTHEGGIYLHVSIDFSTKIIQFSIADTGIGIKEDELRNIFRKFKQSDTGMSRLYGGTGLGLSISKKIAQFLGGELSVSSIEEQGSNFVLSLSLDKFQPLKDKGLVAELDVEVDKVEALVFSNDRIFTKALIRGLKLWGASVEVLEEYQALSEKVESLDESLEQSGKKYYLIVDQVIEESERFKNEITKLLNRKVDVVLAFTSPVKNQIDFTESLKDINIIKLAKPVTSVAIKNLFYLEENRIITEDDLPKDELDFSRYAILIVEDNKVNQFVIKGYLKKFNIVPDIVEDGEQALDITKEKRYDLILMDYELPLLSGFETTLEIKNGYNLNQKTPIYALSAHVLDEYIEKANAYGMSGFLTKPIDFEKLKSVLLVHFSTS